MEKAQKLYKEIEEATKNGHDAEVRRNKSGEFQVYSIKRKNFRLLRMKKQNKSLTEWAVKKSERELK